MALSFGAAIPQGDFASTEKLLNNGFALKGFTGEYSGAYYLTDYFGLAGNVIYASNSLDGDALSALLEQEIPDSIPSNSDAVLTIGIWKQISLTVGPQFTLPISTNLFLDAYALAGINFVLAPQMDLSVVVDDEWFYRTLKVQNVSYVFDLGVALRYNFNESYGLRIYSSYFQSKAKGTGLKQVSDALGNDAVTEETDFSTTIQSIHVGIGLVYRL